MEQCGHKPSSWDLEELGQVRKESPWSLQMERGPGDALFQTPTSGCVSILNAITMPGPVPAALGLTLGRHQLGRLGGPEP